MTRHIDNPFRNLGADFNPAAVEAEVEAANKLAADIRRGDVVVQRVVQPTTVDELYC